jgi:phosphoribosylformylglycinamidine (FGAM) synthase-like enzyme
MYRQFIPCDSEMLSGDPPSVTQPVTETKEEATNAQEEAKEAESTRRVWRIPKTKWWRAAHRVEQGDNQVPPTEITPTPDSTGVSLPLWRRVKGAATFS